MKRTMQVFSKQIIERDSTGKRLHTTKYGRMKVWNTKPTPLENLKVAMKFVKESMKKNHTGYIVYRRVLINGIPSSNVEPLFQAKWGHDGLPFSALKPLGKQWFLGKIK